MGVGCFVLGREGLGGGEVLGGVGGGTRGLAPRWRVIKFDYGSIE